VNFYTPRRSPQRSWNGRIVSEDFSDKFTFALHAA
jgi:hypothetical protein